MDAVKLASEIKNSEEFRGRLARGPRAIGHAQEPDFSDMKEREENDRFVAVLAVTHLVITSLNTTWTTNSVARLRGR